MRGDEGTIIRLPAIPAPLAEAAADVALALDLAPEWLNLGPASLLDLGLPSGFEGRLERRQFGGVGLWYAGRYDLLCFKLYAVVDHWPSRDRHIEDLLALRPSIEDLSAAARWTRTHDPSPAFASVLRDVLRDLGAEVPDERRG